MSIEVDLRAEKILGKYIALSPNAFLVYHKQCALIAVDEIIAALDSIELMETGKVIGGLGQDFLQQVKEKIKTI